MDPVQHPYEGGAEYISVCLPAFTPRAVYRDNAYDYHFSTPTCPVRPDNRSFVGQGFTFVSSKY
jgi:hypothetical protein|tara:strand:- start:63 stop:254 length:192 start_codon:yes stop_codon:yes gene_type:complete